MFLWLSGQSIALAAQMLWVQFPGNTHTDEKMYILNDGFSRFG